MLEKTSVYLFTGNSNDESEVEDFVREVLTALKASDSTTFETLLSWLPSGPSDSDNVIDEIMENEAFYSTWGRLTALGVVAVQVMCIDESNIVNE